LERINENNFIVFRVINSLPLDTVLQNVKTESLHVSQMQDAGCLVCRDQVRCNGIERSWHNKIRNRMIARLFKLRRGWCSDKSSDLYYWGPWFELRSGIRQSWIMISRIPQSLEANAEVVTRLGPNRVLSDTLQLIIHQSFHSVPYNRRS
jgi:hypothetical protein